jgi:hypothetical protein
MVFNGTASAFPSRRCDSCLTEFVPVRANQRFRCELHRKLGRKPIQKELYGAGHQRERAAWEPLVAMVTVSCARCGEFITAGAKWHLGHPDGESSGGPEHVVCNVGAPSRLRAGKRAPRSWEIETVDDPERGVYFGPKDRRPACTCAGRGRGLSGATRDEREKQSACRGDNRRIACLYSLHGCWRVRSQPHRGEADSKAFCQEGQQRSCLAVWPRHWASAQGHTAGLSLYD